MTKTITIEVKGDIKQEANDTFYLDLFGLSSNAQFTKKPVRAVLTPASSIARDGHGD